MSPFQIMDDRGILHFHQERWKEHRRQRFLNYPVPEGKTRIEVELWNPRHNIEQIPVAWNPHAEGTEPGFPVMPPWFTLYSNPDWSTVFEVTEMRCHVAGTHLRLFAEEGHVNPWGERIRFMSTSSEFEDDHANRFAYFRGRYWAVTVPTFHFPNHLDPDNVDRLLGEADLISYMRSMNEMFRPLSEDEGDYFDFLAEDDITIRSSGERYRKQTKPRSYRINWSKEGF